MSQIVVTRSHITTLVARAASFGAPRQIVDDLVAVASVLDRLDEDALSFEVSTQLRSVEGRWRGFCSAAIGAPTQRAILRAANGLFKLCEAADGSQVAISLDPSPTAVLLLPGDERFRETIGMAPIGNGFVITKADILKMNRPESPLRLKVLCPIERALLARFVSEANARLSQLDAKDPEVTQNGAEAIP